MIGDADKALVRLRDALMSATPWEVSGRVYSQDEVTRMVEKVILARKTLSGEMTSFSACCATSGKDNSIILVDFIEQRLAEGMPLAEAVVDAGAVRFRPMLLTALAVVVGASVILADPIFQGLAISLMAGEIASLLISRMAVPVLYFMAYHRKSRAN